MHQQANDPCHGGVVVHDHELVLARVLDGTPEQVWKCWTDPELLKRWFVPAPWSLASVEVDPRPGGVFNTVMADPEGNRFPNVGVVLAAEPNRLLVTTDAFTSEWKAAGQPFMIARVELKATGDGRTEYTATAAHWSAEAKAQHEAMGFHEGWGAAADQLNALLKTL